MYLECYATFIVPLIVACSFQLRKPAAVADILVQSIFDVFSAY